MNRKFSIIGAGNLGTRLIYSLVNCPNHEYELKYIYKKSKFNCFASSIINDMDRLVRESGIIFICTQESRIREAVELAAASRISDLPGKIFFHTSNSLTSDELFELKSRGAFTASFSPLQTFAGFDPSREDIGSNLFKDVYFLAEGDDEALKVAGEIAKALGSNILIVNKNTKIYFHIAAVCASNFLIAILKLAENQLHKATEVGIPSASDVLGNDAKTPDIKIMLPLIRQTLENVAVRGVGESLTGPAKRKEMGIIQKHLEHLEGDEAALYKALTEYLGKS